MVIAQKGELEAILGGVDGNGAWTSGTVEAVHSLALDTSEVDRVIERADNTMVTRFKCVSGLK